MERAPNTEYILSLSYGKDSLACLEAIRQLGYPLDRIIHAEVWATDTIPADLPPMVEFKKYADQVIFDRYGVVVEHIYATRAVERERERATNASSTQNLPLAETQDEYTDSRLQSEHGVTTDLRSQRSNLSEEKITYEKMFYHIPKRKIKSTEREFGQDDITGFPVQHFPWCNSGLKLSALRISNINWKRELVHRTQTTSFQIAPLHRGQK